MSEILGIHHVTAIASDPQRNVDFYAGLLGLRLVKRTVNFDDPESYHLYYGDDVGSPGSIMTFFPWPGARRGRAGNGQVAVVSFSVLPTAVDFWLDRLTRHGIEHSGVAERLDGEDRERVISFEDHDGTKLQIVGHVAAVKRTGRSDTPGILRDEAIRGFHGVTMWADAHDAIGQTLVETLGLRLARDEGEVRRYVTPGGTRHFVDVRVHADTAPGTTGAGIVHHIAWAVKDDSAELELRDRVSRAGVIPTPVIDRTYFHSVYFHEPSGILFELATNPPGFLIDEPADRLGERLMLPRQYENARREIESVLPALHLPTTPGADFPPDASGGPEDVSGDALGFVHRYLPPAAEAELAGATTLLLLHGTGGDENDLIPLGRQLLPGAGLLSPKGRVTEDGAPRFFRRLAEGVFDQVDLAQRTTELADFITGATTAYRLDPSGLIAVGFSNGANIAASLLLTYPRLLRAAILFSPMIPFRPAKEPDLSQASVFIAAGRADRIVPPEQTLALASLLRKYGATVEVHWSAGGHSITPPEVASAAEWILRSASRSVLGAGVDIRRRQIDPNLVPR